MTSASTAASRLLMGGSTLSISFVAVPATLPSRSFSISTSSLSMVCHSLISRVYHIYGVFVQEGTRGGRAKSTRKKKNFVQSVDILKKVRYTAIVNGNVTDTVIGNDPK